MRLLCSHRRRAASCCSCAALLPRCTRSQCRRRAAVAVLCALSLLAVAGRWSPPSLPRPRLAVTLRRNANGSRLPLILDTAEFTHSFCLREARAAIAASSDAGGSQCALPFPEWVHWICDPSPDACDAPSSIPCRAMSQPCAAALASATKSWSRRDCATLSCVTSSSLSHAPDADAVIVHARGFLGDDAMIAAIMHPELRYSRPQLWAVGALWEPETYYPVRPLLPHADFSFGSIRGGVLDAFVPSYTPDWAALLSPLDMPGKAHAARALNATSPLAWVQSNCDAPSRRHEYIRAVMLHMPVDSHGACMHTHASPAAGGGEYSARVRADKLRKLYAYKFVLAFENAVDADYVSEKLFDAWAAHAVPIYWGAPNAGADYSLGPASFIDARAYTPAALTEYLRYLDRNDTAYAELHAWRAHGAAMRTDSPLARTLAGAVDPICVICEALHTGVMPRHAARPTPAAPRVLPASAVTDDDARAAIQQAWRVPQLPHASFVSYMAAVTDAASNTVVFAAGNAGFHAFLHNWAISAARAQTPYALLALDAAVTGALQAAGQHPLQYDCGVNSSVSLFRTANYNRLVMCKWRITLDVLATGTNALMVDPDAVLLAPPLPVLAARVPDCDIAIQLELDTLTAVQKVLQVPTTGLRVHPDEWVGWNTGFVRFAAARGRAHELVSRFIDWATNSAAPERARYDDQTLFTQYVRERYTICDTARTSVVDAGPLLAEAAAAGTCVCFQDTASPLWFSLVALHPAVFMTRLGWEERHLHDRNATQDMDAPVVLHYNYFVEHSDKVAAMQRLGHWWLPPAAAA